MVTALALFFGNLTVSYIMSPPLEPKEKIKLILQLNPWDNNLPINEKLNDLREITLALENYKRAHHKYPVSSENGNFYISPTGTLNKNWIPGLEPDFLGRLPSTPNKYQYRYISNGVLYRIGTIEAEDCEEIRNINRFLIDKYSPACSYGFWTIPHWEK